MKNIIALIIFFLLSCNCFSQTYGLVTESLEVKDAHQVISQGNLLTLEKLINSGIDINDKDATGTSLLHYAVWRQQLEIVEYLVENKALVNTKNLFGLTPIELAIQQRDPVILELLLEKGGNPNTLNLSGESMLMLASESDNPELVKKLLLAGADINYQDETYGQTSLMFAARKGNVEIINLLMDAGSIVNHSTRVSAPPEFIGPNSVPGFGFGEGIIRGGVPKDRGRREPQKGGMTALLYAARHGHGDVVYSLLNHGADISQSESNGISPLLMAISNNNLETASILIDREANVNQVDWYGRSPLWEAINVRNLYVHNSTFENGIDRAPFLPLIDALLERGALVNTRTKETPPFRHHLLAITGSLEWVDFTGQTPFLAAALAGDITVMKKLLRYGADPFIKTYGGTSALMAAAGVNWVYAQTWTEGEESLLEAVRICIDLGLSVNDANSMGITALHGAANRGSTSIIKYLVENGADLNAQDNEGRSALSWARGVFLATHPAEPKPHAIDLINSLLSEKKNKEWGNN